MYPQEMFQFNVNQVLPDTEWEIYVERIHNMKEQIYFYERSENHEAKERMFKSFKWADFPGKHPDAREDQGFLKCEGVRFADFISFILNIP